tara:strand:- start:146 stop:505 length:360 start_codon:yes stop_codon:yes gene_type:complete
MEEKKLTIEEIIIGKVQTPKNGCGEILDEKNNHIADARGWGRFQDENDGDKKHDFLANFLVDAINEKLDRKQRGIVVGSYSLKVGDNIKLPSGLKAKVIETKVKVKDEFGGEYYLSDIK